MWGRMRICIEKEGRGLNCDGGIELCSMGLLLGHAPSQAPAFYLSFVHWHSLFYAAPCTSHNGNPVVNRSTFVTNHVRNKKQKFTPTRTCCFKKFASVCCSSTPRKERPCAQDVLGIASQVSLPSTPLICLAALASPSTDLLAKSTYQSRNKGSALAWNACELTRPSLF